jgi:phospholipid/cholesterol/gamma-HCH transport system permease protein
MSFVVWVGHYTLESLGRSAQMVFILLETWRLLLWRTVSLRFRFRETIAQMYSIGVESLPIVAFALSFVGLMLILEFSFHMKLVLRQDSLVPAFSTVLMLRELGPVVGCLLLTSRVGAGIAAEIGSMRVTEQIDALRLLAIDPIEYLAVPRWIACVFASVALSVIAVGVAMLAGAMLASHGLRQSPLEFFNTMFVFTRFSDLTTCILKAFVFGTITSVVAVYHGLHCKRGSDGVGNAATSAVVTSSIHIIIADFVLTYLLYAV